MFAHHLSRVAALKNRRNPFRRAMTYCKKLTNFKNRWVFEDRRLLKLFINYNNNIYRFYWVVRQTILKNKSFVIVPSTSPSSSSHNLTRPPGHRCIWVLCHAVPSVCFEHVGFRFKYTDREIWLLMRRCLRRNQKCVYVLPTDPGKSRCCFGNVLKSFYEKSIWALKKSVFFSYIFQQFGIFSMVYYVRINYC